MSVHASNTPKEIRDLWRTPQYVFDALNHEFNFLLDAAASIENRLAPAFFSESMNSLQQQWPPVPIWVNPPYSDIKTWVNKAIEASRTGSTVVMLVPADPSVVWFQKAWNSATEMRFISGRLAFINETTGQPFTGNNKGSVIIIWRPGQHEGSPSVKLRNREDIKWLASQINKPEGGHDDE